MRIRNLPVKDSNGKESMKRYLIPVIFFFVALSLQIFLYFSWTGFALLGISTLLLTLILFNLDLESKNDSEIYESNSPDLELTSSSLNLNTLDLKPEAQNEIADPIKLPFFTEGDPISKANEILKTNFKSIFMDVVKDYGFPKLPEKVSSVLYAHYDGFKFEECFWQKGSIFVESESNPIEWDDSDETSIRDLLPCISRNKQKLYIPFAINQHLFGFVSFFTKDVWTSSEIQKYWERSLKISEKILEKREYEKVTRNSETWLFNNSHFYQLTKEGFESKEKETLILIKFIETSNTKEIGICLNYFGKKEGVLGLGLFQLEADLFAIILPNSLIDSFTDYFKRFIEEIDSLGYPSEVAIGYSNKSSANGKFDIWIKNLYLSLEESILYNAA